MFLINCIFVYNNNILGLNFYFNMVHITWNCVFHLPTTRSLDYKKEHKLDDIINIVFISLKRIKIFLSIIKGY